MMFASSTSPEFRAHGVGAMAWQRYDRGRPSEGERLVVVVPHSTRGTEWLIIYPWHAPNNWAKPGTVCGWDGNRESPTFNPSIDCGSSSWHGYIVEGRVCDTNRQPLGKEP